MDARAPRSPERLPLRRGDVRRPASGAARTPSYTRGPALHGPASTSCPCGGSCPRCRAAVVAGLPVSAPGDAQERQAETMADRVTAGAPIAGPLPVQRGLVSRQAAIGAAVTPGVPHALAEGLGSSAAPLDEATRGFMETRFGHDFSDVRVHADARAGDSARALGALAYTVGRHVVFAAGKYRPEAPAGRHLLAHELTHVVQQEGAPALQLAPDETRPPSPSAGCAANPDCPSVFCQPLPMTHWEQCADDIPFLLAGIALKVSSRVVSLWHDYLTGGTGLQDLSSRFAADFTNSATTADTTDFLVGELRRALAASPPALPAPPLPGIAFVDLPSRIGPAIAAIGTPGDPHEMNFDVIGEIPGNIAGGIGRDQAACPVGARPSTQNDERTAGGTAQVTRNADGSLSVTPLITYTVRDTIDLCPGNCGSGEGLINEQLATVPMSRCEASGIYGDVPFVVTFAAPARSFDLPAPP